MATQIEYLHVRVDPKLKAKIKKAAAADQRSLSNYVLWTLKQQIERGKGQ